MELIRSFVQMSRRQAAQQLHCGVTRLRCVCLFRESERRKRENKSSLSSFLDLFRLRKKEIYVIERSTYTANAEFS